MPSYEQFRAVQRTMQEIGYECLTPQEKAIIDADTYELDDLSQPAALEFVDSALSDLLGE
jgi:hypothetical protein